MRHPGQSAERTLINSSERTRRAPSTYSEVKSRLLEPTRTSAARSVLTAEEDLEEGLSPADTSPSWRSRRKSSSRSVSRSQKNVTGKDKKPYVALQGKIQRSALFKGNTRGSKASPALPQTVTSRAPAVSKASPVTVTFGSAVNSPRTVTLKLKSSFEITPALNPVMDGGLSGRLGSSSSDNGESSHPNPGMHRGYAMSEMADIFRAYLEEQVDETSIDSRVKWISGKKTLDPKDVIDRGVSTINICPRFGLDPIVATRLENTIYEMQELLRKASNLVPGRVTCFTIDPHYALMPILRNTDSLDEIHIAWTALNKRMSLAHRYLEKYDLQFRTEDKSKAPMSPVSTDQGIYDQFPSSKNNMTRMSFLFENVPHMSAMLLSDYDKDIDMGQLSSVFGSNHHLFTSNFPEPQLAPGLGIKPESVDPLIHIRVLRSRSISPEKPSTAVNAYPSRGRLTESSRTRATVSIKRRVSAEARPERGGSAFVSRSSLKAKQATPHISRFPFGSRRPTAPRGGLRGRGTGSQLSSKIVLKNPVTPALESIPVSAKGEFQKAASPLSDKFPAICKSLEFGRARSMKGSFSGHQSGSFGGMLGLNEMTSLQREYTTETESHVSTFEGVRAIVTKTELQTSDIRDRGISLKNPVARFSLDPKLFARVDRVTAELQIFLKSASELVPGRTTYFIVDPEDTCLPLLQGAHELAQLQACWSLLRKRVELGDRALRRIESGDERMRTLYSKIPHHREDLTEEQRLRAEYQHSWQNIFPINSSLMQSFPKRLAEENPLTVHYDDQGQKFLSIPSRSSGSSGRDTEDPNVTRRRKGKDKEVDPTEVVVQEHTPAIVRHYQTPDAPPEERKNQDQTISLAAPIEYKEGDQLFNLPDTGARPEPTLHKVPSFTEGPSVLFEGFVKGTLSSFFSQDFGSAKPDSSLEGYSMAPEVASGLRGAYQSSLAPATSVAEDLQRGATDILKLPSSGRPLSPLSESSLGAPRATLALTERRTRNQQAVAMRPLNLSSCTKDLQAREERKDLLVRPERRGKQETLDLPVHPDRILEDQDLWALQDLLGTPDQQDLQDLRACQDLGEDDQEHQGCLDRQEMEGHQVEMATTGGTVGKGWPAHQVRWGHQDLLACQEPELKPENLPEWDGNPLTAVEYFWEVQQITLMGGWPPEAMGYWLWTHLKKNSAVYVWFMALPQLQQSAMCKHYVNYLRGIKEGFLGKKWQLQIKSIFEAQRFRQNGHSHKSPQGFIARRSIYIRMLANTDNGGPMEVFLIMQNTPIPWSTILIVENINDTAVLYARATEHEQALVYSARSESSKHVTTDNLIDTLKSLGYEKSRSGGSRRAHLAAVEEESESSEEEPETEDAIVDVVNSSDDVILKEAFQVLKKRQRDPPKGGYPFLKNDHVTTKMGRLPPSPCKVCGSKNHWDRECPDWAIYERGVSRSANLTTVSSKQETAEAVYRSAYNVLVNRRIAQSNIDFSKFDKAGFKAAASSSAQETSTQARKSTIKEAFVPTRKEEHEPRMVEIEDEDEERARQKPKALHGLLERVTQQQQDIEQDNQMANSPLDADVEESQARSEDFGYWMNQGRMEPPETEDSKTAFFAGRFSDDVGMGLDVEEKEVFKSTKSLNLSEPVAELKARILARSMKNRSVRRGLKMCLCELTDGKSFIEGYVDVPILVLSESGELVEMLAEAYIVPGMTVPILLGEDFQRNYNLGVQRNVETGTKILLDKGEVVVPAENVRRTEDWCLAREAAALSSKFVKAKIHKQNQARKQQLKRKWGSEQKTIRAAEDTKIAAGSSRRIRVVGELGTDKNWVVEKNMLADANDSYFAIPNTLISASNPFLPVANTTTRPRYIRKGEALGTIHAPQEFFDSPSCKADLERMQATAKMVTSLINARIEEDGQSEKAKPDSREEEKNAEVEQEEGVNERAPERESLRPDERRQQCSPASSEVAQSRKIARECESLCENGSREWRAGGNTGRKIRPC
ncbi:hypothetical protein DFH06DRAFT_1146122 [Mycena polygramma]|nr:hypothetical protein DFH06DRAFT_1146122 [Mycena polygramma]